MQGINRAALLYRLMIIAVLGGGLAVCAANRADAQQDNTGLPPVDVRIEAQPLNAALVQAGREFGVVVVAPENLTENKTAPSVFGALTADQAINRLLAGSGLEARRLANGAFVVSPRAAAPNATAAPAGDRAGARAGEGGVDMAVLRAETLIVTAQKREENIQDVPISLSVFSAEEIQASNFIVLEDYALRTPNMSFQNNGGGARTLFSLRGIGGGNIASGTGTPVGFYVDEIILNPTGGLRQNDLALFDLERIEVLRGPQGTLFGRNTIGGAVNLVTRKPDERFSGRVIAGLERFGTYSVQGHINVPLTDKVFVQGSAIYRETDGFIENTTTGKTLSSGATGGRLALRIVPAEALTIDLTAMRNELRYDGLQTIPEANFDAGRYEAALPFQVENQVKSNLFSARVNYDAGGFDVISLTAYNDFDADETLDATGFLGPVPAFAVFLTTQETISQEVRVQSNNPDAGFRWLVGANYARTKDALETTLTVGTPDNPIQVAGSQIQSGRVENIAVFANFDIALNDVLTFTAGARYSWDEYDFVTINGTAFPGSNEAFTPRFNLQYQPSDTLLLYASVSRGYRAGGVDTQVFDPDPTDELTSAYDPETAWNYEIGVNATLFDERLFVRAAAFLTDYDDIQAVFFLPGPLLETITTNGASARIYGVELDVSFFPDDYLSLNANLGLLNTEFTSFDDSPEGDLTGNRLSYAPDVSLSVVGQYYRPLSEAIDGFIRLEFTYRSDQEGRNNNNPTELQPGYDLVNIRAGIETEHFKLEVYGENVFDKRYLTNRRPGQVITVTPGRPATWGVRASAWF